MKPVLIFTQDQLLVSSSTLLLKDGIVGIEDSDGLAVEEGEDVLGCLLPPWDV